MTKISTIDSGFEFPFTEDSSEILLHSSEWDVVEPTEMVEEARSEKGRGGPVAALIAKGEKAFRARKGAVAKERTSGPRRWGKERKRVV